MDADQPKFDHLYVEDDAKVEGLGNEKALEILIEDVEALAQEYKLRKKAWSHLQDILNPFNPQSIVNVTSLVLLLLSALILVASSLSVWLWLLLVCCATGSVMINVWDNYCRHYEIYYRIRYVLSKLRECIHYEWNETSYPHLYMPFSPCINLQWAYRAGHVVNVPWSLLVRGDFILLRPGQPAPAYCTRYQPKDGCVNELKFGDVYNPTRSFNPRVTRPTARTPVLNTVFVLQNTPYVRNLEGTLLQCFTKPVDYYTSSLYTLNVKCVQFILYPALFVIVILVNLLRLNYYVESDWLPSESWIDLFLIQPITVTLPLLPLVLPVAWFGLDNYGNAVLQSSYQQEFSAGKSGLDLKKRLHQRHILSLGSWSALKSNLISCMRGDGRFVTRTANLLHVLGSVSTICCVDKKGILSWPNPTAEKVFFLRSPNSSDLLDARDISEEPTPRLNPKDSKDKAEANQKVAEVSATPHLDSNGAVTDGGALETPCRDGDQIPGGTEEKKSSPSHKLNGDVREITTPSHERGMGDKSNCRTLEKNCETLENSCVHNSGTPEKNCDESLLQKPAGGELGTPEMNCGTFGKNPAPAGTLEKKRVQIAVEGDRGDSNQNNENDGKRCDKGYKQYRGMSEVLDLTHNKYSPFELNFDNTQWFEHLSSLKPLGLAILLNTCNKYTQAHYTQFCSHVTCQALYSDLLVPVANRSLSKRCLCELARQIGFAYNAAESYALDLQLSTYRHFPAEKVGRDISFARSLQLPSQTKLKFPFPHMVAVIVRETKSASGTQLFSQGTADILLDSCIDYWNGEEVVSLTLSDRKKIQDFYQRTSLLAYCTAFAYRPLMHQIDKGLSNIYIELSPDCKKLYEYCQSPELLSSSQSTDNIFGKEKELTDVGECFQEECNQVFIGMVTMQYQTIYDMVDLVEELDHACIRFVHFSKENELRSRVFSEKMGLESGWNCHISLSSDQNQKKKDHNLSFGNNSIKVSIQRKIYSNRLPH
uniref:Transmembrane protein 94 n=1 Tax=Cacopsylla melanoneura TaxID=428564 RepID=A0A8D8XWJ3_9HEMI